MRPEIGLLLVYFGIPYKKWPKAIKKALKTKDPYFKKLQPYFQKIKQGKELTDKNIETIAKLFKNKRKKIQEDTNLTQEEARLLQDIGLLLRKDSKPAKKRILKTVKHFYPVPVFQVVKEALTDASNEDSTSAEELLAELEETVKKLTGKKALDIVELKQRQEARQRDEALYKHFLKLRRQLNELFKKELENYFIAENKELIPVEELRRYFKQKGIPFLLPKGLKNVLVDIEGNLYTKDGKIIEGKPPYTAKVEMGNPGSDFVFKAELPAGTQYYYTKEFKATRRQQKFKSVADAIKNIEDYAQKWRKLLMKPWSLTKVVAAMIELLYRTQARVGSSPPKDSKKGGYGLTTLLAKHAKVSDGKLVLSYKGKKGVKQRHVITPDDKYASEAIEVVKKLLEGKQPNDPLFTWNGKRITAQTLNKMLEQLKIPITAHKFRHIVGTMLAEDLLTKAPKFRKQKKAIDYFKKALTKIGKVLGHMTGEKVSWTTAKDNYIDPKVMLAYFERQGIRPPSFIKKFL